MRNETLLELIIQAGGVRKAEALIKQALGSSPSKSAIHAASQGKSRDYATLCIVRDLKLALENQDANS
jgi:hypothetical protein